MNIRLKELRQQKKLYQKDIAKYLNIAISTYSYWENGTYDIDLLNLQKLADYYNVSIDYILGHDYDYKNSDNFLNSNDEKELIKIYRKCNEKNKTLIMGYANGIMDKE